MKRKNRNSKHTSLNLDKEKQLDSFFISTHSEDSSKARKDTSGDYSDSFILDKSGLVSSFEKRKKKLLIFSTQNFAIESLESIELWCNLR